VQLAAQADLLILIQTVMAIADVIFIHFLEVLDTVEML
jgi:hypothetical protein